MTQITDSEREAEFAPCPTCKQYSHTIREDNLGEAILHFQTMYAHPVRGHPMGHIFDEKTRDMAQLMLASTTAMAAENQRLREALAEVEPLLAKLAIPCRADDSVADEVAALGHRIGYGNLMVTASALWRANLDGQGIAGGEFSANICQKTAENAWYRVCAALNGSVR